MLWDRCLVCPICNVGVLWPNGWTDQDTTRYGGRPRPRWHCVRWEPSSPPPRKGAEQPPTFAYVYCGQMVAHLSYCWALVLDKPGSVGSPLGPPSVPEENLWGLVEWVFLQAGCPSRHPITSVKALQGTQCTNPNPGLILASFTTDSWWKGCCFLHVGSLMPVPHASIHTAQHTWELTVLYSIFFYSVLFLQCAFYSVLIHCSDSAVTRDRLARMTSLG